METTRPTEHGATRSNAPDERLPGRYRRWDGVTITDSLVFTRRPLTAVRLNDAAITAVEALGETRFERPRDVASRTGMDRHAIESLFDRLHRRGLLEWAPDYDQSFRPSVSVVVPTKDAESALTPCLDALAALDYPRYEVVVVDGGSSDGTVELARSHRLSSDGTLRVVEVGTPSDPLGIGESRNRGVEAATGSVVAFTDADCRPRSDWLSTLVPRLAVHDVVGGRVRPTGSDPVDAYEGVNSSLDMGAHGARVDPDGSTPYLPTANLVGHASVFESVRFPRRDVAEDVEFCWRAVDAAHDVVYEPTGLVEHAYRDRPSSFARRRATYAASEALLSREFGRGDRIPLASSSFVGFVFLLTALVGSLIGVSPTPLIGLSVAGLGGLTLPLVLRVRTVSRKLDGVASVRDVGESVLRSAFSTTYAVSREVARYYSAPLTVVGLCLAVGGVAASSEASTLAGVGTLSLVAATAFFPALTEYVLYRPSRFSQYAAWYALDHTGYQWGAYVGAANHRTVAHLVPWRRFRLSGVLGTIVEAAHSSSTATRQSTANQPSTRRIHVGDASAVFRVQTDAERWWFDQNGTGAILGGETPVVSAFLDDICPDDVVLDVGANVGLYTCLAGDVVSDGAVVAVEPEPTNADRLVENLAENTLDARVCRLALSDSDGDGVFQTVPGGAGVGEHAVVETRGDTSEATETDTSSAAEATADEDVAANCHVVRTTTGDSLFDDSTPDVVKVDVEGSELAVLCGLDQTLSDDDCRVVYCEVHPDALRVRGHSPSDVVSLLLHHGFALEYFTFDDHTWRCTNGEHPNSRHIVRGYRPELSKSRCDDR